MGRGISRSRSELSHDRRVVRMIGPFGGGLVRDGQRFCCLTADQRTVDRGIVTSNGVVHTPENAKTMRLLSDPWQSRRYV
jgi:hypothetical protein